MPRHPRDRADELERGREAYARRAWLEAHELLVRAHEQEPLDAQDLELLATTAYMLGRDDDSVAWLERGTISDISRTERRFPPFAARPGSA